MAQTSYELPVWKRTILPEIVSKSTYAGTEVLPLPDGKLLLMNRSKVVLSNFRIYDPLNGSLIRKKLPMSKPDIVLILPNLQFLFLKHHRDLRSKNTEFILWDFMTDEQNTFEGNMPFDQRLNFDLYGEKLHLISSFSVGGSSGGFDWTADSAMAATIDLKKLRFTMPFHEIEDSDVAMMAMLDSRICFVQAYSRTSIYHYIRDVQILGKQDHSPEVVHGTKPDFSNVYKYRLKYAGRDSQGGLLFCGDSYVGHINALFRWHLDNPKFEMVGHWEDFNGYYSSSIQLHDGSSLIICAEREKPDMVVRRYMPGEQVKNIARIGDVYAIGDIVLGADGRLYMCSCNNALKDGKWYIAGDWELSVIDMEAFA